MKTSNILFSLIRVAIVQHTKLPCVPSDDEWKEVLALLKRHTLLGIGFVAIQKLPKEQWPPSNIILTLSAYATQIKAKNAKMTEECHEVVRQMEHDGIHAVVIKGQSNWENYPEELREYRQCGDIDIWTAPLPPGGGCCKQGNTDDGIAIAVQTGDSVEYEYYKGVRGIIEYARLQRRLREDKSQFKPLYYHVEYHTEKGTEVEMHYRPSFLCSPIRNMRMQQWFKEQFDVCLKNKCQLGFPVLTSSVNVVYQLVHLYRHVFEGGIGLRQLMDYYFALRVWHNDVMECKDLQSQGMWSEGLGTPAMSKEEVMAVLRSFGMCKFAGAIMWVINEVFGGVNENNNENENCPQMTQMDTDWCPQADGRSERECPQINREFKENNIYPQINTDGHRCPQADYLREQQFTSIGQQLKEIGPQADEGGEQQVSDTAKLMSTYEISNERIIIRKLSINSGAHQAKASDHESKENNFEPWMICEPNEVEGKKLLAEIMRGGNFGQYDTRDAGLKKGGMVKHGVWKLKRVMRLVSSYPEEALWEPVFRVYHLLWRLLHK